MWYLIFFFKKRKIILLIMIIIRMGRTQLCSADGLKKGAWTAKEDQKLIAYVQKHGEGSWRSLPQKAGLQRCGKSCRLRWANYLRPGIKRGDFTSEEDQTIIVLHTVLGNRWAAIARHLPKRTDTEIKNYWKAHLRKRLTNMGIDPLTHKPIGSSGTRASATDPMTHNESAIAQESEPTSQRPKSSMSSTSASALPLNKLAPNVTTLQCVDPLSVCHNMQLMPFSANDINSGPESSESAHIICHPTPMAPDTSAWLDDIADPPIITPLDNCLDLSNEVLSLESGDAVSADSNIEYSVSEALSILENSAISELEPALSNFSSTAAARDNMASEFASLNCIDEFHDNWQNNPIQPGPIQDDHSDYSTTSTSAGELWAGDIYINDMIFDIDQMIGSPVFHNS